MNPFDFGGMQINKQDILSDDMICKIKNLNPVLGGELDPLYDQYQQYRDEFNNAELIIIDANALNRSSLNNLDLSGRSNDVENMPFDYYQMDPNSMNIMWGEEFDPLYETHNMYEGFEAFSAFGDVEFSADAAGY